MGNKVDLAGMRFGHLTVVERAGTRNRHAMWLCVCDCGGSSIVEYGSLRRGATKSCGCGKGHITHGKRNTRIYRIWADMKARCFREKCRSYKHYGGRGISMCDEWKNNFQSFYDWAMANGYQDDLTIDRIDVNGNYEPANCRWATWSEQQNNKRVPNGHSVVGLNEERNIEL